MAPKSNAKTGEAATAKAKKATKSPFKAKAMSPKAKLIIRVLKPPMRTTTAVENSVTDVAKDEIDNAVLTPGSQSAASPASPKRSRSKSQTKKSSTEKAAKGATKRAPTGAKKGAKTVAKKAKVAKSGSPQRARSASPKKTDSADDGQQNGEEVTVSGGERPKKLPKKATKKAPKKATESSTKAKSSAAIAFEDSVPDDSDDNDDNNDNNDDSDRDMTWKPERRKQSLVSNNKSANSDESDSDVECDDYESGEEADNDLMGEPTPSTSTSAVTAPKRRKRRVLTKALKEYNQRYWRKYSQSLANRFVCSWKGCGRGFKRPSDLTNHMRIHTDERPFPCNWPNCRKAFKRAGHLENHVQLIHKKVPEKKVRKNQKIVYGEGVKEMLGIKKSEEVFECVVEGCGKTIGRRNNLITHQMKKHSNEIKIEDISKPAYRCSLCPTKVTTKRLFETIAEMKRHHFKDHFTPKIKIEWTEEMKVQRDQQMAAFDAKRAALQKIMIEGYRRFQAEPSDEPKMPSDENSEEVEALKKRIDQLASENQKLREQLASNDSTTHCTLVHTTL